MTHPLSEKQRVSLKESNAKINIWQGAVRSGKTYISLWRYLKEITYGPKGEYAIISRTYDAFERNVLAQLTRMIGADARYYSGKRKMRIWGKDVFIIGADDDAAEAKIRGPTFQGAYVDEATIIPESVWMMLKSRCAMGEAKIFATTNPDSPYHWFKKDCLEGNPDVRSWHFTLEDNPQLTEEERAYLRRQYKGIWYKRFIEGLWTQAEGAIYDFFDEQLHVIDYAPEMAEQYICGVDYGTTNTCAFVLIGMNRYKFPNMWVEAEYYHDSRVAQRQKTDSEYADDLQRFLANKSVTAVYVDPAAASFKLELRKTTQLPILEGQNEVLDGIRLVSKYMNNGTLKITRRCQNLIKEMQSYVWDHRSLKTGVDKPLKENDHALDALRYAIYTHFFGKDAHRMRPEDIDKNFYEAMGGNQAILPRPFGDFQCF